MSKRQKKSKEELTAESYFPVDKLDVERATEKEIKKSLPREEILKNTIEIPATKETPSADLLKKSIEKKYYKPTILERETIERAIEPVLKKSKSSSRKSSKNNKKEYFPEKISLKQNGYEMIITEKPQAAFKIASALGKITKKENLNVPYYELEKNKKKIIVTCAVGHLFTLKQENSKEQSPVFNISWIPNYLARKKDFTKRYYDTILKIVKNAGSITIATDYDIEGEVIGLNIVRYLCGQKDASRMKFSTLTEKELEEAYEKKSPTINWGQAIAGETRHYLDWYYGINLSRALMEAIKSTGKFRLMSIGRVQGPTLKLIVDKEKEILNFKSENYWQVFIKINDDKNVLELKYVKDIFDKSELEKFKGLNGKTANAMTEKSEQKLPPQPPFNLTTLQTEVYKFYGITPSKTLQIAQSLYLASLISYPRTSSQKLPASIGYEKILNELAKKYKVQKLITKKIPLEGKKSDPAHPSIYPTGNSQILSGDEEKIYNLIVKRFLSLFCDDAIIDNKIVKAEINNLIFSTRGFSIRKKSWLEIYPSKLKENQIPDMNGKVKITDSKIEQKETQPPKRFSQASIISQLEKKDLGTKSTRANILETLYDRNYINGQQSISATPFGISLIQSLEKHSPIIIDEKLTRQFEQKMESIQTAKKEIEKKEKEILEDAKKTIVKIIKQFKEQEKEIGNELVKAQEELREQQKKENTLVQCPKCKKGNLAIKYSPKTKRQFIACDSYPECKTTFSLPPNGIIKKTNKICEKCNFPTLMRLQKGKRPWEFCFNQECETNKEWVKKREERLEKDKNI